MLAKETSIHEHDTSIHHLVRVNLQACSACGRFFITTFARTKKGELVLREIELDLKVRSSRIRPYDSSERQGGISPAETADRANSRQETCW